MPTVRRPLQPQPWTDARVEFDDGLAIAIQNRRTTTQKSDASGAIRANGIGSGWTKKRCQRQRAIAIELQKAGYSDLAHRIRRCRSEVHGQVRWCGSSWCPRCGGVLRGRWIERIAAWTEGFYHRPVEAVLHRRVDQWVDLPRERNALLADVVALRRSSAFAAVRGGIAIFEVAVRENGSADLHVHLMLDVDVRLLALFTDRIDRFLRARTERRTTFSLSEDPGRLRSVQHPAVLKSVPAFTKYVTKRGDVDVEKSCPASVLGPVVASKRNRPHATKWGSADIGERARGAFQRTRAAGLPAVEMPRPIAHHLHVDDPTEALLFFDWLNVRRRPHGAVRAEWIGPHVPRRPMTPPRRPSARHDAFGVRPLPPAVARGPEAESIPTGGNRTTRRPGARNSGRR